MDKELEALFEYVLNALDVYDYISALEFISKIYERFPENKLALFLEGGIRWHNEGWITDELLLKLKKMQGEAGELAISYIIQSWSYELNKEVNKEKECLLMSMKLCGTNVYPFERYSQILKYEGDKENSRKYAKVAINNVRKIYTETDEKMTIEERLWDYINEYITANNRTTYLYGELKKLL